ncbi:MAG TPA: DUF4147 domain-containing protein [Phycisphaerales bacterium]
MPRPVDLIAHAHAALAAIQAATDPRRAVRAALERAPISRGHDRLHLFAIGKASLEMTLAALDHIGHRIDRGLVAAAPERLATLHTDARDQLTRHHISALPCDHPLATQRNLEFAAKARDFVSAVPPDARLLALISGGGSAHLASPPPSISLDELRAVTNALLRSGATIAELNAVRKHVETLKGGRLAELCSAPVDCLTISDVIGDHLDVIASGPFAPDPTTFADALAALDRRNARRVSAAIADHLTCGVSGEIPETPKPGSPIFDRVHTSIIAHNHDVVHAVGAHEPVVALREEHSIEAPVDAVAEMLVRDVAPNRTVVLGGEWTVNVGASRGRGGPSQELAVRVALLLEAQRFNRPFACLCYSTDGIDGPTDAAGAIVHSGTIRLARAHGIDAERALREHDSHSFFMSLSAASPDAAEHLRPGPTGTNVNHIAALWTQA